MWSLHVYYGQTMIFKLKFKQYIFLKIRVSYIPKNFGRWISLIPDSQRKV
jgi:hypothetical protein